ARESVTLTEFYDKAKTRRYPEARIRRMALWVFLNLKASDRPERVPYLRVLGCNDRGRAILKEMKQRSDLPILTKPGQIRKLDETAQRVFELECRATDLWRLCLPETGCRLGNQEWLRGPVVLPDQAD
ncbi:MAG: nucleotidyltransferase family protein, partial [Oscillospiraceae bacterium]|nr:nucleotidyltransferase family protein [Oscillospiraceae bacterium]